MKTPILIIPNKNRIKISCNYCKKEFYVHNCRKNTAKFCSYKCSNGYRKGKTLEELYGIKKAKEINKNKRINSLGQIRNSFFGHPIKECKCGCGQLVIQKNYRRWGKLQNKLQEYISGHNNPENKFKEKEKIKKVCLNCGKEFKVIPALKDKRVNCSKKCKGEYMSKLLSGKNNPLWQDGKSFEPYGIEFNKELKGKIRKRDNCVCQECGRTQKELKRLLNVHHIDYNKQNNSPLNLISLCLKCHMKTNHNRKHWKQYFQMKMFMKELFNPENLLIFNENKQLIGIKNII